MPYCDSKGLFACCFLKLFRKIVFKKFFWCFHKKKKKKCIFKTEFWKTVFVIKKTWLVKLIKKFFRTSKMKKNVWKLFF